ncbi:MAG: hypothetical protein KF772_05545 [Cryobacterium sp.]|nr:hypothetical protein [Cryobacterium sp.]
MRRGYAVLDFETTGFSPRNGDRVVEIGAVYLGPDLRIDGGIETLVNPLRDVGPTRIHGISPSDVFDAPTFEQIAPSLIDFLDGRVIVGHNVSFDLRFLEAELQAAGYKPPEFIAIDTLSTARSLLATRNLPSFKLVDVGHFLGIDVDEVCEQTGVGSRAAHTALGDALVTAFITSRFIESSKGAEYWDLMLDRAESAVWPERVQIEVDGKRRGEDSSERQAHTISEVVSAIGKSDLTTGSTSEYTTQLEEAMLDRILTEEEIDELIACATNLGIEAATLGSLHRGLFDRIVQEAWADGKLTLEERNDIERVASLLGIDSDSTANALLSKSGQGNIQFPKGSNIVLTGDMSRPRSEIEAEIRNLGFVITSSVSRKTSLVIAADPYTLSGKGRRARELGVPVVTEIEGLQLLRGA